ALPAEFAADRRGDIGIGLGERGREKRVGRGTGLGAGRRAGRRGHGAKYLHRRSLLGELRSVLCGGRSDAGGIPYRAEMAKHLRYKSRIYARYGGMPPPAPDMATALAEPIISR